MIRSLTLLLLLVGLAAEEAPRTLDPAKPADAVQIVANVAAQVPLKLADSQVLLTALQTLAKMATPPEHAIGPVTPPTEPTKKADQ